MLTPTVTAALWPHPLHVSYVTLDGATTLWATDVDDGSSTALLENVFDFAWYHDANRIIYTPRDAMMEIRARRLDTGSEVLLLSEPHLEVEVDPNGRGLTYCAAESHYNMTLKLLPLTDGADGLPRPAGDAFVMEGAF